jgi:hypothetical protein
MPGFESDSFVQTCHYHALPYAYSLLSLLSLRSEESVLWGVTLCKLACTGVSDVPAASVIRLSEYLGYRKQNLFTSAKWIKAECWLRV